MSCACENTTKRLIVELGVIGKITRGYKLNTKEAFIALDNCTWYQGLLRTYRGDSRQTATGKITKIIEQAEHIIMEAIRDFGSGVKKDTYMNMNPRDFLKIFINVIKEAREGVENLKITYSQDTTVLSCLNVSLITLGNCIKETEAVLETDRQGTHRKLE